MDSQLAFGTVGPAGTNADGTQQSLRQGRLNDLIISQLHGRLYEQSFRKNLFFLDSDSVTLASANTTKGALATVKLINGFWNPTGSGVNAVIIKSVVATVSGTPAGPFFYNYLPPDTINSAVTGTIKQAMLARTSISAMQAQVNVVVTDAASATTALTQLATMGGPAAVASGAGLYGAFDLVDGAIIVPPGFLFGILATGAGTNHIVQSTLVWEEVPA